MKTTKILSLVACTILTLNNTYALTTKNIEDARKVTAAVGILGIPVSMVLQNSDNKHTNHRLVACPHIRQESSQTSDGLKTSFNAKLPEALWSAALLTNQVLSAALEKDKSLALKVSQRIWQIYNAQKAHVDQKVPMVAETINIIIAEAVLYASLDTIQKKFPKKDQMKLRRVLRVLAYTANSCLLAAGKNFLDTKYNSKNPTQEDLSVPKLVALYIGHHTAVELLATLVASRIEEEESQASDDVVKGELVA